MNGEVQHQGVARGKIAAAIEAQGSERQAQLLHELAPGSVLGIFALVYITCNQNIIGLSVLTDQQDILLRLVHHQQAHRRVEHRVAERPAGIAPGEDALFPVGFRVQQGAALHAVIHLHPLISVSVTQCCLSSPTRASSASIT